MLAEKAKPDRRFVYVLRSETFGGGMTKVGMAICVDCRCRHLSHAHESLSDLRIVKVWERRGDARAIELRAHKALAEYQARNEWFRCPADVACAAVERIIAEVQ